MAELSNSDSVTDRVLKLIDPIVTECGCEAVEVELSGTGRFRVLRVLIDKTGGVNVEDCSKVSGAIEDLIEVEGLVSGPYSLEVSSPGLDRPLRKPAHFVGAVGSKVRVVAAEKKDGRQNYSGVLRAADESGIVVDIDGTAYSLSYQEIRKARMVYEFGAKR